MWRLPNDPDTRTTRQLVDVAFGLSGQSRARLRQVHPLLLRAAAISTYVHAVTSQRSPSR